MTSQGILWRLKQETREYHRAVERQLDLPVRLRSIADYLSLLERLYGFYGPLETHLEGILGFGVLDLELDMRRKEPLLLLDLLALGRDRLAISSIALCTELPVVDDVPQALGCLYVLEGATLGGQIISRQLEERLAIDAGHGGRFFASYGAAVAERWQAFGKILVAHAGGPEVADAIVASARSTFDAFGRWFEHETVAT